PVQELDSSKFRAGDCQVSAGQRGAAWGRLGPPPPAGSAPARSGRPGPTTYFDDRRAARRCVTTALCIQLPMFDTTVAVHTTANVWRLNGSNGDTAPGAAVACG